MRHLALLVAGLCQLGTVASAYAQEPVPDPPPLPEDPFLEPPDPTLEDPFLMEDPFAGDPFLDPSAVPPVPAYEPGTFDPAEVPDWGTWVEDENDCGHMATASELYIEENYPGLECYVACVRNPDTGIQHAVVICVGNAGDDAFSYDPQTDDVEDFPDGLDGIDEDNYDDIEDVLSSTLEEFYGYENPPEVVDVDNSFPIGEDDWHYAFDEPPSEAVPPPEPLELLEPAPEEPEWSEPPFEESPPPEWSEPPFEEPTPLPDGSDAP